MCRKPDAEASEVPSPLRIVGGFMMLIGGLVFLLVFTPQENFDRAVTVLAAAVLTALGLLMRHATKPLPPKPVLAGESEERQA